MYVLVPLIVEPLLQQGVYLIDGRAKPDYQDGEQRYENDGFMEDMIKGLRRQSVIQRHRYVPEDSRFGVSPQEIEQVILPEFARAIRVFSIISGKNDHDKIGPMP